MDVATTEKDIRGRSREEPRAAGATAVIVVTIVVSSIDVTAETNEYGSGKLRFLAISGAGVG